MEVRRETRVRARRSLPSWTDGEVRDELLDFVRAVTTERNADCVRAADRVAAFDNGGTLWVEHPTFAQAYVRRDRLVELASSDPETAKDLYFHVGRRPLFAFGNSDSDLAMLAYTKGWRGTPRRVPLAPRRSGARSRVRPRFSSVSARPRARRGARRRRPLGEHEARFREGVHVVVNGRRRAGETPRKTERWQGDDFEV